MIFCVIYKLYAVLTCNKNRVSDLALFCKQDKSISVEVAAECNVLQDKSKAIEKGCPLWYLPRKNVRRILRCIDNWFH